MYITEVRGESSFLTLASGFKKKKKQSKIFLSSTKKQQN